MASVPDERRITGTVRVGPNQEEIVAYAHSYLELKNKAALETGPGEPEGDQQDR